MGVAELWGGIYPTPLAGSRETQIRAFSASEGDFWTCLTVEPGGGFEKSQRFAMHRPGVWYLINT